MIARAARVGLLLAAVTWGGAGLSAVASLGCVGAEVAAIEAASEARSQLFAAEEEWVAAVVDLADRLTTRAEAGVALPGELKASLRSARDDGRRALQRARRALAAGDIGAASFGLALGELVEATRTLVSETRRL